MRVTSKNPLDRQTPFGVPPIAMFVGFGTAVAALGVANQAGILTAIANVLSKLFILCCC